MAAMLIWLSIERMKLLSRPGTSGSTGEHGGEE